MPKRVQRKRTKGWKMPDNTKYVGRPTKYGNPFIVRGDLLYCDASHRRKVLDPWVLFTGDPIQKDESKLYGSIALFYYRHWLNGLYDHSGVVRPRGFTIDQMKEELQGKNLACWCDLDHPCHVDVLMDVLYGNGEG
ncbi:MAG: DUF4326 domain-containing protein [Wenzhouxiangella sp.]|nr:DUF4326 domain-containing protein [Wenzhouxiangella sp.]